LSNQRFIRQMKIHLFKVGGTYPDIVAQRGDYEDWTLAGMGITRQDAAVVNIARGEALPDYRRVAGVVITGSHAMVTDRLEWSERAARWLPEAVARRIPILGICYGHQLLAHALDGVVGNNPQGNEYGNVMLMLDPAAIGDPLFGGLSRPMEVHACHTQSVIRLPKQAVQLASSSRDPNAAFVVNGCAWGVQFHPEFDAPVMREYIRRSRDALRAEGQDPETLIAGCTEIANRTEILQRFAAIVLQARSPQLTIASRKGKN
jgi:GMP synthase (glutamine-hydrolysing)